MDPRAFDELSKRLAEKTSRGRALKLFGGALVGTFVGAGTAKAHPPQKHCKYARYSCQRNIDCCSNNCCNRICCDDGMTCCGGECLRCPAGQTVDPNTCECVGGSPPPPPGTCGNGTCDAGETCSTCPDDCGLCECQSDDECPEADPGSCLRGQCDSGTCTFVEDDSNVPDCGECAFGSCNGGVSECFPAPVGHPCSSGFCDGTGQCVQCVSPTECPGQDTECAVRTCVNGMCGFLLLPAGSPCGTFGICDGNGNCIGG